MQLSTMIFILTALALFLSGTKGQSPLLEERFSLSTPTDPSLDDAPEAMHKRRLMIGENGFVPLDRNRGIGAEPCRRWSTEIGTANDYRGRVVIPAGDCIEMDLASPSVIFRDGLDIQGKLVLPNGYTVTISTTIIIVQGELHMSAVKQVDGEPNIKVILIGDDDETFEPVFENSHKCGGSCSTGKKAIVVAGGRVNILGMPLDTPTWLHIYDVTDNSIKPDGILVSDAVWRKWGVGAEILITSYTAAWNKDQVRTITGASNLGNGFVELTLNEAINRPTTLLESPDFATEVALLSRNIVFEGATSIPATHGGHFWVLETPRVQQRLEGVEFVNFGQQGNLGRYPIHFHLCGDVSGARVLRNTIRQSNQRCVVVHGTDNLLIEENVAYDTKGHCFILEDGMEKGNRFIKNLGARTGAPARIIPNMGDNGIESDDLPSTFWIPSFENEWIGNVAAGSEDSGFWFEPMLRGPYRNDYDFEPNEVLVTLFRDNVAHSNVKGFRTYPAKALRAQPGSKNYFTNMKAFRNSVQGLFIHLCWNLVIEDSLFADNGVAIDIDKADAIDVINTVIIGETPTFREQFETQGRDLIDNNCRAQQLLGVQVHTFGRIEHLSGHSLDGVTFQGFEDTHCTMGSYPIDVDGFIRAGRFWGYTTLNDITLENSPDPVEFCKAAEENVALHIADLDGSIYGANAPAALVSNVDETLHFINPGKCTENADRCYSYCEDTCMRTITYETPTTGTANYSLKTCRRTDPNDCVVTPSYYFISHEGLRNLSEMYRRFTVHVPDGLYIQSFIDNQGQEVWPTLALKDFQTDYQCPGGVSDADMELHVPAVTTESCRRLITNPGMELITNGEPNYWQWRFVGLNVLLSRGVGGSVALTPSRPNVEEEITQWLDSRCMSFMEGQRYRVTAHIKLLRNGNVARCFDETEDCPEVGLFIEPLGERIKIATTDANSEAVGGGFFKVIGDVNIDSHVANSDKVRLYVRSTANYEMIIDDVTMNWIGATPAEPNPAPGPDPAPAPEPVPVPAPVPAPVPTEPTPTSGTREVSLLINCGEDEEFVKNGELWVPDSYYLNGETRYVRRPIVRAVGRAELFRSERVELDQELRYRIPVRKGIYEVDLYFSETKVQAAGRRVFDVSIEDQLVLDDLDIFEETGAMDTGMVRTFRVRVTDLELSIDLTGSVREAKINAIGVYRIIL